MSQSLVGFLLLFPLFIVAVSVHEVSHGIVALYFGDSTALRAGRLTLNPFRHIDLFGTVLLPGILLILRAPIVFGWAKPVPVNSSFLRHPKRDMLWVGAAGPVSNFLMAAAGALVVRSLGSALSGLPALMAQYFVLVNLFLGVFNLLPIPPLDGSRVLTSLLPAALARGMIFLERWGFLILILLLSAGIVDRVMMPIVDRLAVLFLGAQ